MLIENIISILNSGFLPTWKINGDSYILLKNKMTLIQQDLANEYPLYKISVNTGIGVKYEKNGKYLEAPLTSLSEIPWIGIHSKNKKFDSKSQTGVYLTILFNASGSSVSLSLQYGSDKLRSDVLNNKNLKYRTLLGLEFKKTAINLTAKDEYGKLIKPQLRAKKYEKANIYGQDYNIKNLNDLNNDLPKFIAIYENLINKTIESDEIVYQLEYIDVKPNDYSDLIDRNNSKVKTSLINSFNRSSKEKSTALKKANFKCELNNKHETFLTESNINYVEGHHIIPVELYQEFSKDIDHWSNIISLCPNCHRKIHLANSESIREMINDIWLMRGELIHKNFNILKQDLVKYYNK